MTDDIAGTMPTPEREPVDSRKVVAVRYVGLAHIREITSSDWAGVECTEQGDTVWSAANGHTLPVTAFTDKALEYIEAQEPFLQFVY